MYNHYYRPIASAIEGTKIEVSIVDNPILIVIKAADGDEAIELGKSIVNLADWELDHVADV